MVPLDFRDPAQEQESLHTQQYPPPPPLTPPPPRGGETVTLAEVFLDGLPCSSFAAAPC